MIVSRLTDSIGNQTFQYAFGRQLQEIYHMPLIFETAMFRDDKVRKLGLHRLAIPLVEKKATAQTCRIATGIENTLLAEYLKGLRRFAMQVLKIPVRGQEGYSRMIKLGLYMTSDSIRYYPFEKTRAKLIFARGFFQSEHYFHDIAPLIQKELRVKAVSSDAVKQLAEKMAQENSVCIQIRRGDYVGHPKFDVCGAEYYKRAVSYIQSHIENPVLYVFSNSPEELNWIKQEYPFLSDAHFVKEGKDEFDDLYMIYHCRHHIISNSTFGWWGAYLKIRDGLTVCPGTWNNYDLKEDITLKEWIHIPV